MTPHRDARQSSGEGAPSGGARLTPGDLSHCFSLVHTERLELRLPCAADGPAMFRIHGDPATNRYNPRGPDPDLDTDEHLVFVPGWPIFDTAVSTPQL